LPQVLGRTAAALGQQVTDPTALPDQVETRYQRLLVAKL
jgi:hypothetical protein